MNAFLKKRKKWVFSLLSALCALALLLIMFAVGGVAPFGDNTLVRGDAALQYVPLLSEAQRSVREGGSLLYSWADGLGGNYYATICYYLLNPFNAVALLFPAESVTDAYALVIVLSIMLAAFCAAWYLQSHFSRSDLSTVLFSLLYTFSGFFFAYFYNTMWLLPFALLPLVALGIETLSSGGKPWLYLVSLALCIFTNFYLGYMICIFSVLYFFVCLFSRKINKQGEDDVVLLPTLFKFGGASLAAGGLCGVTLLPMINALSVAYVKSIFESDGLLFFNPLDFLTVHLPGVLPPNMVMTQYTLPTLMLGSVALILLPLYAFVKSVPKNERGAHIVLTVLLLASFEIPTIYYIWHGFSAPAALPYRFIFLYAFLLVKMAYTVWHHLKDVRVPLFALSGVLLAAAYIYSFVRYRHIYPTALTVGAVCTVLLFVLFLVLRKVPKSRKAVTALALVITAVQLCACSKNAVPGTAKSVYLPLTDATAAARELTDAAAGGAFYRAELAESNYITRSDYNINGAMLAGSAYGYHGVSTFSSLCDTEMAFLQYDMGNYGNLSNGYAYASQTPIYNTLFGVEYVWDNADAVKGDPYYTVVGTAEDITVYRSNGYLGLGLLANPDVETWDGYSINPFISQASLWQAMTGQENVLETIPMDTIRFYNSHAVTQEQIAASGEDGSLHRHAEGEYEHDTHDHEEESADTSLFDVLEQVDGYSAYKADGDNYSVTYTFTPQKTQNIFINVRAGMFDTLTVDNEKQVHFFGKRLVDLGVRQAGVPITVTFTTTDKSLFGGVTENLYDDAVYLAAAGVNDQAYKAGLQALQENGTFQMTEFSETEIKGTVIAAKDCVMTVAMPYDAGWTVTVDGEATELIEHSSHWMMFSVPAGEHEIEMHYFPQGLKEGIFASAATLLMIFLSVLLTKMRAARFAAEEAEEQRANAAAEQNPSAESAAPESETTEENPPQVTE